MLLAATQLPSAAAQPMWRYTALGDSLAVGVGATRGYVPRYLASLSDAGPSVQLANLAVSGWTSDSLVEALATEPVREAVASATVLTWNIGGNDLLAARSRYKAGACGGFDNQQCYRTAVDRFQRNWDRILEEILTLRSASDTVLRTMDIYHPYARIDQAANSWPDDGDLTDFDISQPYLEEVNAYIHATTAAAGIPCAAVYQAFHGVTGMEDPVAKGYIAPDGLHPSDAGYAAISDQLRLLGYAPLPFVGYRQPVLTGVRALEIS
jgi:lysophospholipase L1-like esterase